jgi:AraC family transcriptional regulator of adaptative response / DNA-3-methyladenine glycosylase II
VIPEGVRIGCGGEGGFEKRLNEIGVKARRVLDIDAPAEELEKMFPGRGGVRVPGAWDEFEMGVRAILGQQVTVKAAHTLAGRLAERWGRKLVTPWEEVGLVFPEAELVAELAVEELRAIGLTRQRAETVKSFAGWMAEGQIGDMEALPGIGPWTRAYFDMRSGRDRDAFPAGDLGVQKALGIRERGTGKAKRLAEARAEKWRPWRAYAVMLLWTGGMPDEADTGM